MRHRLTMRSEPGHRVLVAIRASWGGAVRSASIRHEIASPLSRTLDSAVSRVFGVCAAGSEGAQVACPDDFAEREFRQYQWLGAMFAKKILRRATCWR